MSTALGTKSPKENLDPLDVIGGYCACSKVYCLQLINISDLQCTRRSQKITSYSRMVANRSATLMHLNLFNFSLILVVIITMDLITFVSGVLIVAGGLLGFIKVRATTEVFLQLINNKP